MATWTDRGDHWEVGFKCDDGSCHDWLVPKQKTLEEENRREREAKRRWKNSICLMCSSSEEDMIKRAKFLGIRGNELDENLRDYRRRNADLKEKQNRERATRIKHDLLSVVLLVAILFVVYVIIKHEIGRRKNVDTIQSERSEESTQLHPRKSPFASDQQEESPRQ